MLNNPAFADCIPVGVLPDIEILEPGEQLENGKFTKAQSVIKSRRVEISPIPEARATAVNRPAFRIFVFNGAELLWTERVNSKEAAERWIIEELEAERLATQKRELAYQERKQMRDQARAQEEAQRLRHQEAVKLSKQLEKNQLKFDLFAPSEAVLASTGA